MAVEIVNGETDLSITRERFEAFTKDVTRGTSPRGDDYSIVAIMGGQSGGKSTILNLVFGTDFATLDASKHRRATTHGIWMGRPSTEHHPGGLLVIDCEGSDSDEKDESLVETFARQSALFSLALAEVLIVNLWAHDIGKRQGQNLPVLETIFEVNLSLFHGKHSNRTKLIFLIRDHIEETTPLDVEKECVMRNITEIWDRISKPEGFADSKVSDVFDIEFVGLHHYMLQRDRFMEDVESLKRRFGDPAEKESFWATEFHLAKSRDVPLKALYDYVQQLWTSIKDRDELNIVSQKASLTNTLCEKHVETAYASFRQSLESAKLDSDLLAPGFGAACKKLLDEAVESYDANTFVSQADKDNTTSELGQIKHKRRTQLMERVMSECSRVFDRRMRALVDAAAELFQKELKKDIPTDGTAISNLNESVFNANKAAKDELMSAREDSMVPNGPTWDPEEQALEEFKKRVKKIAAEVREQQFTCLKEEARKLLKSKFAPKIAAALKQGPKDMWDRVHAARKHAVADIKSLLDSKINGFMPKDDEVREINQEMSTAVLSTIRSESLQSIEFIDQILLRKFDGVFRLDADGIPRKWQKNDDIRSVYLKAKAVGLETLKMYATFELGEGADEKEYPDMSPEDKIFLADERTFDIERRYLQSIEGALREAQNQANHTIESVPVWAIVLILVLGYNEITAILFSPIFLPIFVVFASVFMVIYMLGLTQQAQQVAMMVAKPAILKLGQAFSPTAMIQSLMNGNSTPVTPPTEVEMQSSTPRHLSTNSRPTSNGVAKRNGFDAPHSGDDDGELSGSKKDN